MKVLFVKTKDLINFPGSNLIDGFHALKGDVIEFNESNGMYKITSRGKTVFVHAANTKYAEAFEEVAVVETEKKVAVAKK